MNGIRGTSLAIPLAFAVLLSLSGAEPARAFHFPWDQGHDTFTPNPGDDNNPGDGDDNDNDSDPFKVATGNWIYTTLDLEIPSPALGHALRVARTYNSHDNRSGPFGHGWIHTYDIRLIEVTDKVIEAVLWRRDDGKRERFVQQPDGSYAHPEDVFTFLEKQADGTFLLTAKQQTRYRFDAGGKIQSITSRSGHVMTFSYDGTGFLTSVTDPSGRSLALTKGPNGKISSITDPAGRVFAYGYDEQGNLTRYTDALGNTTVYSYDAEHNLTAITDPRGNQVQSVSYDAQDRVSSFLENGERMTITYTPSQNRTQRRDAQGNTWIFTYNDNGNIIRRDLPVVSDIQYEYTDDFLIDRIVYPSGGSASITHDDLGNITTITNAAGETVRYSYHPVFNTVTRFTDGNGNATDYEYDGNGNLIRIQEANGRTARMTYDSQNRLTAIVDPLGNATRFEYDAFGNPTRVTDPEGNVTRMAYDGLGNMTAKTDPNGNTSRLEYDAMNRITRFIDAAGNATTLEYDPNGNLTRAVNPRGAAWNYTYDAFDRITSIANPLNDTVTFSYDVGGNLTSRRDARGLTTSYTYDGLDRLTRKTYSSGGSVTFSYDSLGNLSAYNAGTHNATYSHDPVGRLTQASVRYPAGFTKTVRYSYGDAGELLSMTDPENGVTAYSYDAIYKLLSLTNPSSRATTWNYDAAGVMSQKTLPNGVSTHYGRDAAARLTSLTHQLNGANLASFSYGYDPVGNIVSMGSLEGQHQYVYDVLHRLSSATHPVLPAESYTYDAVGNRLTSAAFNDWTYNLADRLLSYDGVTQEFDANGNLVQVQDATGTTTHQYDAENRLTRTELPDGTVISYVNDPFGKRLSKTVAGATTNYVYDTYSGTAVLLAEYNASGQRTVRYTSYVLDPLIVETGGGAFFYHTDHLGTPIKLTDTSGNVVWEARYSAFGEINVVTAAGADTQLRFPGQYEDPITGLYYNLARYYDPATGRYTTSDPAIEATSPLFAQLHNSNAYAYVGNNPVNQVDPQGTSAIVVCSLGLPVCSAAIFCSANVGACSGGLVCSANIGACSAAVACSGTAAGACSGGAVCSGNAGGACSGAALCSGQLGNGLAACSASIRGCSGQIGAVGASACSANLAGACSGQASVIGGSACSAQATGACSGQLGTGAAACSGQLAGACSGQAGPGVSLCSGQLGGACSAQIGPGYSYCSAQGGGSKCPGSSQYFENQDDTLYASLDDGGNTSPALGGQCIAPSGPTALAKTISGLSLERIADGGIEVRLTTFGYRRYDLQRYQPQDDTWLSVTGGDLRDSQILRVVDNTASPGDGQRYRLVLVDGGGQSEEIGPLDVAAVDPESEQIKGVGGFLDRLFGLMQEFFGVRAWAG